MTVHVHRSNRLEALADALAEVVRVPPADPFAEEIVVTPSRGMAQWVRLALAERLGIVAQLDRWSPRQLVDHALEAWGALPEERDRWAAPQLAWTLLQELPAHAADPAFAPLSRWLDDDDVDRSWQLARRVAHVFDQYATYRPRMVHRWSDGQDVDPWDAPLDGHHLWQPVLWRALEARLGRHHVAALTGRIAGPPTGELPERVALFGLTALPPLYLDLIAVLGEHVEVHLFHTAPTPEWWADVRTRREQRQLMRGVAPGYGEPVARALHLTEGHPLLASLGRLGRELQGLVEDHLGHYTAHDHFVAPAATSMLGAVQSDLHAVRAPAAAHDVAPDDASIQVHGCHSPAREVEVLRDRLHGLLAADPTLRPRDIVVLTPDIATHGPLIDAVFGVDPDDPLHVPYTVADRPLAAGHEVARALLAVLGMVGRRLSMPEVLAVLAHAPVRGALGLTEADVEAAAALAEASGVRWGADAAHRAREGQPEVDAYTWRFGIDRLVLGHLLGDGVRWAGRVPHLGVEGDAVALVGALVSFWERLEATLATLQGDADPSAWRVRLEAVLDGLLGSDEHTAQAQEVREQIDAVVDSAAAASFEGEVPLPVLRDLLEQRLGETRRVGSFLRAGITFCELLPMRAIPFRVVAVLGLSDGAFPRTDSALGFDLVGSARCRGDRSRRDDDRQLLLDALLSARDALVVTYQSHSVQDNKPLPPSVVLADVLDALEATFADPGRRGGVRARLVCHHPLQPFGEGYVTGRDHTGELDPWARLVTFDADAVRAAREALGGPVRAAPVFVPSPLPPQPPVVEVPLRDLLSFWRDPVRWFVERRLRVSREEELDVTPDREPLELDGLDQWSLGERLLTLRAEGLDWRDCEEVLRGEGRLPLGQLAMPVLSKVSRRVAGILGAAGPRLEAPPVPPVVVDAEIPVDVDGGRRTVRLTGRLGDLREGGRVVVAYTNLANRPGHQRLQAWIQHLALQLAEGSPEHRGTEVFARAKERTGLQFAFPRLDDPAAAVPPLSTLVGLYVQGHAVPLPFDADAAWQYLAKCAKGDTESWARREAAKMLESGAAAHPTWQRVVPGAVQALRDGEDLHVGGEVAADLCDVADTILRPLQRAESLGMGGRS